jgi:hypothetical protein
MSVTVEDGLRALEEAAIHARTIVVDLDEAYLRHIAEVEAMPSNQPGADKTWGETSADAVGHHFAKAVRVR